MERRRGSRGVSDGLFLQREDQLVQGFQQESETVACESLIGTARNTLFSRIKRFVTVNSRPRGREIYNLGGTAYLRPKMLRHFRTFFIPKSRAVLKELIKKSRR